MESFTTIDKKLNSPNIKIRHLSIIWVMRCIASTLFHFFILFLVTSNNQNNLIHIVDKNGINNVP